jgi:hypothetical protein
MLEFICYIIINEYWLYLIYEFLKVFFFQFLQVIDEYISHKLLYIFFMFRIFRMILHLFEEEAVRSVCMEWKVLLNWLYLQNVFRHFLLKESFIEYLCRLSCPIRISWLHNNIPSKISISRYNMMTNHILYLLNPTLMHFPKLFFIKI